MKASCSFPNIRMGDKPVCLPRMPEQMTTKWKCCFAQNKIVLLKKPALIPLLLLPALCPSRGQKGVGKSSTKPHTGGSLTFLSSAKEASAPETSTQSRSASAPLIGASQVWKDGGGDDMKRDTWESRVQTPAVLHCSRHLGARCFPTWLLCFVPFPLPPFSAFKNSLNKRNQTQRKRGFPGSASL